VTSAIRSLAAAAILVTFGTSALGTSSVDELSRSNDLHDLIDDAKLSTDLEKLNRVNDFFNQNIKFKNDIDLWGVSDYWATPSETLIAGAGDCEDYSIAKYFSLLKLGIRAEKLRITYVTIARRGDEAHMILSYFPKPGDDPLVMDSLIPEVKRLSKRADLTPLFSFNNSGLWFFKKNVGEKRISNSCHLDMWGDMKLRMSLSNA